MWYFIHDQYRFVASYFSSWLTVNNIIYDCQCSIKKKKKKTHQRLCNKQKNMRNNGFIRIKSWLLNFEFCFKSQQCVRHQYRAKNVRSRFNRDIIRVSLRMNKISCWEIYANFIYKRTVYVDIFRYIKDNDVTHEKKFENIIHWWAWSLTRADLDIKIDLWREF